MKRVIILASPRTGSTYLSGLLNSHPEIEICEELLNAEVEITQGPIQYVEQRLSNIESSVQGFKVFPSQIRDRGLTFKQLVDSLSITNIIVIWRRSILAMYSSYQLAIATDIWTSKKEGILSNCQVEIEESVMMGWYEQLENDWKIVASQWPVRIKPIFVEYDDLVNNPSKICNHILYELSLEQIGKELYCSDKKINTAPIQKRIANWASLTLNAKSLQLNIEEVLEKGIKESVHVSSQVYIFVPDREPPAPLNGYRYTVAQPFIPLESKANVYECVESEMISSAGPWIKKLATLLKKTFETNGFVQPCANGFVALVLALQAAGIKSGDEVICPSLTMIAVPNAIRFVGATPKFADSSSTNYNPSFKEILSKISASTKGIILTHTYGVPTPDIYKISEYCTANKLWLIEDISEAVGIKLESLNSKKPYLGTFGDFACASLYANKIVHGGDGGFVLSKDPAMGPKLTSLVNHGFTPSYHFVHYETALNGKMTGMSAAMACGVIKELDHIMTHRSWLSSKYRQLLTDPLVPLTQMMCCGHQDTPWVFGVECSTKIERTKLRAYLAQQSIETRDYFFPLHLQPVYFKTNEYTSCPNAENFGSTGFYLPTHTNLTEMDIVYIVSCIKSYYSSSAPPELPMKEITSKEYHQLIVLPGKFEIDVKNLLDNRKRVNANVKYALIDALEFCNRLSYSVIHDEWDVQQMIVGEFIKIYEALSIAPSYKVEFLNYTKPFLNYFEAFKTFETPIQKPWHEINLSDSLFEQSFGIPTTTDPETIQLLLWLIKTYKTDVVWEIGTLFGHVTARLAAQVGHYLNTNSKIYAVDGFQWQTWMEGFIPKNYCGLKDGQSFMDKFIDNIAKYSSIIQPVQWFYDAEAKALPEELKTNESKPKLIYLDITHEAKDLESIWKKIKPQLIENETIIVFNGVISSSLDFFTAHKDELKPFIGKPRTIAKAFLYSENRKVEESDTQVVNKDEETITYQFETKLRFHTSPTWTHHHQNCFSQAIEALAHELHKDDATTYFIPAVEETICDYPEIPGNNPWIGIIHNVINAPELYYTSDLQRLCTKRFDRAMKNCKGLITLTSTQAEYLKIHLKYKIPIQFIHYPIFKPIAESGTIIWNIEMINFALIGSFARDFELFYNCIVPKKFRKVILTGDEEGKARTKHCPTTIEKLDRLTENEYESFLRNSVVFLSLEHEGAANTIVVECIARNVPILLPNIASCTDYIGKEYPLLYDWKTQNDFTNLLSKKNIKSAIKHIELMDKSFLSIENFVAKVKSSAVLKVVVPPQSTWPSYDVTISVTSYKRTNNLNEILDSLWNLQEFTGTIQIIVWNNNAARSGIVKEICRPYLEKSGKNRKLELIDSSENYYCSIRFSLTSLMKSDKLLICDDDIIPNSNFVTFFLEAHTKYPNDVLCLRGHFFEPHQLDLNDSTKAWHEYENLKFVDDDGSEAFIHFVHADACCIPKTLLDEICSVPMPDPTFALVDDYWMSFVLNHYFGRMLRKLNGAEKQLSPIRRTPDSDTIGLALYTKQEVQEARDRLYIHHMLQGWPKWETIVENGLDEKMGSDKMQFWNKYVLGLNIYSSITVKEIEELKSYGITAVRIGAVGLNGIGPGYYGEFEELRTILTTGLDDLKKTIEKLGECGISVVLTIAEPYATPLLWKCIAQKLRNVDNIVGYDVINEPFLEKEKQMHWAQLIEMEPNGLPKEMSRYLEIVQEIREIDPYTPIIVEPSFWGHIDALRLLPLGLFKDFENIIVSFHFYEPRQLTQIKQNPTLQYSFPGNIPVFKGFPEQTIMWNSKYIHKKFKCAKEWANKYCRQIFIGEFGIHRVIPGAEEYLQAIIDASKELDIPAFLFSYKDLDWDAHRYDFGSDPTNFKVLQEDSENLQTKILKTNII